MKYLFSGPEMKNWEKLAMEDYNLPSLLLMERAAAAVVKELTGGGYELRRVLIVCGAGNNGGDGLAAARMLHQQGICTDVYFAGAPERMTKETKQQYEMYEAVCGKFVPSPDAFEYTVIVDALFGIGCSRELHGTAKEAVEAVNASEAAVVSIDIPSGISAENGSVLGCAVKADATVTFFTEKRGMALYPGREYCGRIVTETLDVPLDGMEQSALALSFDKADANELLPPRKPVSHKGTYGRVLVIAGCPKMSGAAYLASAAAYRIGAGLVKLYTVKENRTAMQTLLPEALLEIYDRKRPSAAQLRECIGWADCIVIGPGFGTDRAAEKILKYVMQKCEVPLVIDADGINLLARDKQLLAETRAEVVLTPHAAEMARLYGKTTEQILSGRTETAENFVKENPAVTLVLKDAATLVAADGEKLYINTSGNPGMATGGSGDVLAGMIGGLLAQGLKATDAARLGVYIHGLAGDVAAEAKGFYSMIASDLLDGIAEVTKL